MLRSFVYAENKQWQFKYMHLNITSIFMAFGDLYIYAPEYIV